MRNLLVLALPSVALTHGLTTKRNAAVVPPHGGAKYTLEISATEIATPHATANVSWSGISEAASGDWIAVCCDQPTGGYYWWQYTSGKSTDSQEMHLWATGLKSGCNSIYVAYYTGGNSVIGETPLLPVLPMIQQVHLSLVQNDTTSVVVEFVSSGSGDKYSCAFGESPGSLTNVAKADSFGFPTIGTLAQARLTGLAPATRYYYACTDGVETSDTFSFVNQQDARPAVVAVFADFGVDDGFGLAQIAEDAAAGSFDVVVHAGDMAYDFESGSSTNGNFFNNRAMAYSTGFPVMPSPGNHEGSNNFTEYKLRYAGVANHSNSGSALFYSWDFEGIHFLAFNSETYIDGGIEEMLNFMKADLAAVDRARTPWVVAYSHKHWWMDNTDFSQISPLLQAAGVDVLFAGHWHYYYRLLPYDPVTGKVDAACARNGNHTYIDPKYVTMIVSGAPGDVERNDACPGSDALAPFMPACSAAYGYGTFAVPNATHLRWNFTATQTPIGAGAGRVVTYTDELWIVRSQPPA